MIADFTKISLYDVKNHLKDNITKDDMSNKFFWDNIVAEVRNNRCALVYPVTP